MKRVYIGQYGYFWSLSIEEWLEICRMGANGEGYDLKTYRMLRRTPKGVVRNKERGGYCVMRNGIVYLEPLDWYPEDFQAWLDEYEENSKGLLPC